MGTAGSMPSPKLWWTSPLTEGFGSFSYFSPVFIGHLKKKKTWLGTSRKKNENMKLWIVKQIWKRQSPKIPWIWRIVPKIWSSSWKLPPSFVQTWPPYRACPAWKGSRTRSDASQPLWRHRSAETPLVVNELVVEMTSFSMPLMGMNRPKMVFPWDNCHSCQLYYLVLFRMPQQPLRKGNTCCHVRIVSQWNQGSEDNNCPVNWYGKSPF